MIRNVDRCRKQRDVQTWMELPECWNRAHIPALGTSSSDTAEDRLGQSFRMWLNHSWIGYCPDFGYNFDLEHDLVFRRDRSTQARDNFDLARVRRFRGSFHHHSGIRLMSTMMVHEKLVLIVFFPAEYTLKHERAKQIVCTVEHTVHANRPRVGDLAVCQSIPPFVRVSL